MSIMLTKSQEIDVKACKLKVQVNYQKEKKGGKKLELILMGLGNGNRRVLW